jgi:hypothetical protein
MAPLVSRSALEGLTDANGLFPYTVKENEK